MSNVKDTKKLRLFCLKILQKFIMNMKMKSHPVTVRLEKINICDIR